MTVTATPVPRKAREITVSYLGELLFNAGFIDEKQRAEVDAVERQWRAQQARAAKGSRTDEEASPFKALTAMNLTDASGNGTRIDDFLLARLIAEDAGLHFYKIDALKLDVEMIEAKISRPFARKHRMVPVAVRDGKLIVAVVNPFDRVAIDSYQQMVKQDIHVVVSAESDVMGVINEQYGFRASVTKAERDLRGDGFALISNLEQYVKLKSGTEIETSDAHIVNAVDFLLQHAYDSRASDIHIEPKRESAAIRFRIDCVLHEIQRVPKLVNLAITSRLKTMCRMDIAEKRRPQDGRIKTDHQGKEVELRVSTLPTAFGEKMVMRIFDPDVLLRSVAGLGFYEDELVTFNDWIKRPHGIILVTGPTGSGKTVTLYSALKSLASPEINITTIEDPIEMVHDEFNQTAVQAKIGITFAHALRTILRQDPDIIMVGEIRDTETAEHAVQAALTGHLVLSTLHTNDAPSSITRLLDLGIPHFLITSTLIGILAQRLVRENCKFCVEEYPPTTEEAAVLRMSPEKLEPYRFKRGKGCLHCRQTGYIGRTGVFEVVPMTEKIRRLISGQASSLDIYKLAREEGMRTLREAAVEKVFRGVTTVTEMVRVTGK